MLFFFPTLSQILTIELNPEYSFKNIGERNIYGLWTCSLAGSNSLKLKCLDGFVLLLKSLTEELECCGLLVDYCDVFISCLDSHSDGTHSLQSIHC